jgi:hypothetical protein
MLLLLLLQRQRVQKAPGNTSQVLTAAALQGKLFHLMLVNSADIGTEEGQGV